MVFRRASSTVMVAVAVTALLGLVTWGSAAASSPAAASPAQATAASVQSAADQPDMGEMMAAMAQMQEMMGQMMGMMAGDVMSGTMPMATSEVMSGTVPAHGMAHGEAGRMGQMMAMMGEMQSMMAQMQSMMADGMMSGGMMSGEMPMMGQTPAHSGVTMVMPMAGGMVCVLPASDKMMGGEMSGMMDHMSGMMEQMGDMGMMGEMPMMQGMDMGGMMGQDAAASDESAEAEAATAVAGATAAAPQTGQLGEIEVKVTPPDLTNVAGETMDFTVDLNATGADLGLDLSELATLRIGDHEMPAAAWEVAFDHGHHVSGILQFPAHVSGAVDSATLTLTDPEGGPDVILSWPAVE